MFNSLILLNARCTKVELLGESAHGCYLLNSCNGFLIIRNSSQRIHFLCSDQEESSKFTERQITML